MPKTDLSDLVGRVREYGSIRAADLPRNAVLHLQVGGRHVEMCFTDDPSTGRVSFRSDQGDDWVIWLHLTTHWGSTAGLHTVAQLSHVLVPGCRLYIGPVYFSVIEKIVLDGLDLANPAALQKQ